MAALDDLSQKIIVVVLFTSVFAVIWLIVKQRGSLAQSTAVKVILPMLKAVVWLMPMCCPCLK